MIRKLLVKILGEEFKGVIFHLKSISLLTVAYALSSLMGFLITLIPAKKLDVHTFGIFSLAYATTTWIAVIGNFGVGASMIRLYNKYFEDKDKQRAILLSSFIFEIFIALVIILISPFLSYFVLQILSLEKAEAYFLFLVAFISGAFFVLWIYLQEYIRARERFRWLSFLVIAYSLLRMILLVFVYFAYPKNSIAWLMSSYFIPLFFILALFSLKGFSFLLTSFKNFQEKLIHLREIVNYSKWIALSSIAGGGILYFSRFMLAKVSSLEEVGIFSAGVNLALGLTVLYTGLYSFLYPKITTFNREQVNRYFKLLKRIFPLYLFASLIGIIFLGLILWFFLGERYFSAIPVFFIVSFALIVTMFLGLISMLLHTMMMPKIIAYVNILRMILVSILTSFLASSFGAVGGALAYGLVLVVGEMYMVYRVMVYLKEI